MTPVHGGRIAISVLDVHTVLLRDCPPFPDRPFTKAVDSNAIAQRGKHHRD
jgi:hypothetical protein